MIAAALCLALLQPAQAPADLAEVWDKVSGAIERGFYARDTRKDEMERRLAEAKDKALAAKDRYEFSEIVNRMIAGFEDSHFGFYPDWTQGYYTNDTLFGQGDSKMPHVGAWFAPTADGYTVTMVLDGLQAAEAGVRAGDVFLNVGGEPFTPIESLRPLVDKEAEFEVRRGEETLKFTLEVEEDPATDLFLEATRKSRRVIERDGKKIGYFRLWMQIDDRFRQQLDGVARQFQESTDAMILDLRAGFGGRPEGFGAAFFFPPVDFELKAAGQFRGLPMGNDKPLAVLIDGGTRSAKEVTSFMFKKSGRAVLVGTNTAGAVIGTTPQRVADWAYINVPVSDARVDGVRLEDLGVAPDIEVQPGYDAEGRDVVIEAAIDALRPKL